MIRLGNILSQSQQIAAYVRYLYIEADNISSVVEVCANMVNVTSLALHDMDMGSSDDTSFLCRFIEALPSLSALTVTDCLLNDSGVPHFLDALSTIESFCFFESSFWDGGIASSYQPSTPWRMRSLWLQNMEGLMDIFCRHPILVKLVKRFVFCYIAESSRQPLELLRQMKENLEELEVVDGDGDEGPIPSGACNLCHAFSILLKRPCTFEDWLTVCPFIKVLTLDLDNATSHFRAIVPKGSHVLQELRVLVGIFYDIYDDGHDDQSCFEEIQEPLEELRSLIISEHIPKVVLKVHRCYTGQNFTNEAFEIKMRECLFVPGRGSEVDVRWENYYWSGCDCPPSTVCTPFFCCLSLNFLC